MKEMLETIVWNNGRLCLNEKHIKEWLDHKHLRKITTKYNSNHRKHRYEPVEEPKKQFNIIFADKTLEIKVNMDFRTTTTYKFKIRLKFKQYDVILAKEQSVLTKMMISTEGENMHTQHKVLSYSMDLYFHDYKLAIEIDENGNSDRNID